MLKPRSGGAMKQFGYSAILVCSAVAFAACDSGGDESPDAATADATTAQIDGSLVTDAPVADATSPADANLVDATATPDGAADPGASGAGSQLWSPALLLVGRGGVSEGAAPNPARDPWRPRPRRR